MNGKLLVPLALLPASLHAQLAWTETVWDFGTVEETDGCATHSFVCRNEGDEPVVIQNVRASCGCTTADYPKTPIAGGDTAKVVVVYNPEGRPGYFDKDIRVYTGSKVDKLTITGRVIPSKETVDAQFPFRFGNFCMTQKSFFAGEVIKGNWKTVRMFGYNDGNDTLQLAFEKIPSYWHADIYPATAAPGESVSMILTLDSRYVADYGLHEWQLPFSTGEGVFPIDLTATLIPDKNKPIDYESVPQAAIAEKKLVFEAKSKTKPVSSVLHIKNEGASTLKVLQAVTFDDAISTSGCPAEAATGEGVEIAVTFDPSRMTGKILNSQIIISTNDPANMSIPVHIAGQIE